MTAENDAALDSLSYEEKNRILLQRQKQTLEEFRERNAISQEQYEEGQRELEKMKR